MVGLLGKVGKVGKVVLRAALPEGEEALATADAVADLAPEKTPAFVVSLDAGKVSRLRGALFAFPVAVGHPTVHCRACSWSARRACVCSACPLQGRENESRIYRHPPIQAPTKVSPMIAKLCRTFRAVDVRVAFGYYSVVPAWDTHFTNCAGREP